jgi:hypothetical protein
MGMSREIILQFLEKRPHLIPMGSPLLILVDHQQLPKVGIGDCQESHFLNGLGALLFGYLLGDFESGFDVHDLR